MKCLHTLLIVTGLLACPSARAQDATRRDFRTYTATLVGSWTGRVTSVITEKDLGAKGDAYEGRWEAHMDQENRVMAARFRGPKSSSQSLCYFDAGAKKIRETTVSSKGFTNQHEIYPDGDKWIRHTRFVSPDGTVSKLRSVVTFSNSGNTITVVINGQVGDRVVKEQKNVWHRVEKKPVQEWDFQAFFQGTWKIEMELGGKKTIETARCIGTTGNCNVWFGKQGTSIHGYDPKTKSWRSVGYFKDGSRMERVISAPANTTLAAGTKLKFSDAIFHPDGRITYATVHFTCLGPGRFHEVTTRKDQDGKTLPSVTAVLQRVEPANR